MNVQEKFDAKNKRIDDAVAFRTPDMVPFAPMDDTFCVSYAGHTMAEAMYDFDIGAAAQKKATEDFDYDICPGTGNCFFGYGPAFDEIGLKMLQWAGQKGSVCTDMSIHQYVEKTYMSEDDYPLLLSDMSGYVMSHVLPEIMDCTKPLKNINFASMFGMGGVIGTIQFADPTIVSAFTHLNNAALLMAGIAQKNAVFEQDMMASGYPLLTKGMSMTAFDLFSDCLRGTLGISEDMITQPEMVEAAINMFHYAAVGMAQSTAKMGNGKFIFIPLHKGIDMFMSDEHYGKFYWPTLKALVESIVAAGYVPYLHTEGQYYSRLKYLEELPEHSCVLAFTDMDMKKVKETVGKHNCITGGFDEHILATGTKQQVEDEVKRVLDICAPGSGYLFAVDRTLEHGHKPENVEAMANAVRKYGKY